MNSNNSRCYYCPYCPNFYCPYIYRQPLPIQPPIHMQPQVHLQPQIPAKPQNVLQPVRIRYRFTINSIQIDNTRSVHEDTVVVSMAAAVNGKEVSKDVKSMGNRNNGVHPVNLSIEAEVGPGEEVSFSYIVMNNHAGTSAFESLAQGAAKLAASKASSALAEAGGAIGGLAGAAAGYLIGTIGELFAAGRCDGIVAADKIVYKSSQIENLTTGHPITHRTYHPGTDSPWGCGSNSKYYVNWTIQRL